MTKYTNISGLPLSIQVYLATDHYDHDSTPNTISATSLLKPIKQLVLSLRANQQTEPIDLIQLAQSRMGTAIHTAIETAWETNYKQAMVDLGYPDHIIKRVVINKPVEDVHPNEIPIYYEQRIKKEFLGYTISGKYDFIQNGVLEDFKSTSTYSWINKSNDKKYQLQGSIYRWLNPQIITADQMQIQFIFTDWSASKARIDSFYPQQRILSKVFDLLSIKETESFIRTKLLQLEQFKNTPESDLPNCTDEELWRSEPVFKYYKNPEKTQRSTKNFTDKQEAYTYLAKEGVGTVIEKPGQVTACKFCPVFNQCSQKDQLISSGDLIL